MQNAPFFDRKTLILALALTLLLGPLMVQAYLERGVREALQQRRILPSLLATEVDGKYVTLVNVDGARSVADLKGAPNYQLLLVNTQGKPRPTQWEKYDAVLTPNGVLLMCDAGYSFVCVEFKDQSGQLAQTLKDLSPVGDKPSLMLTPAAVFTD